MKDKLELNMYVRIKWSNGLQTISQCKNIVDIGDTQYSKNDFYIHTDKRGEVIYKSMIVKASNNLIDLIEVGDYVNGLKVIDIVEKDIYASNFYADQYIELIVTKEQVSSMEYRLGGKE